MKDQKIKVGITHGDTNGIGYEVILKALEHPHIFDICIPVIYGSAKIANFYRKTMEMSNQPMNQISKAADAKNGACNIINVVGEEVKIEPGLPTQAAGEAAFTALERATADLRKGEIDVLVTAPINKKNIQSSTFMFPGHTEYLESSLGDGDKALMILCHEELRMALVTTHLPLSKVAQAVTREAIEEKLSLFDQSLKEDFGIVAPRIAVLSLNPHAGDNGLLGDEEQERIIPAIAHASEKGILCFGPYPADGLFGSRQHELFDGILAMYHDQGLAPFKALARGNGVNYTAGLKYVRTSPDHGTAYDIAGKGTADCASMRNAIYYAIDILKKRREHAYIYRNPLKQQYANKGKDNVVLDLTKDDEEQ